MCAFPLYGLTRENSLCEIGFSFGHAIRGKDRIRFICRGSVAVLRPVPYSPSGIHAASTARLSAKNRFANQKVEVESDAANSVHLLGSSLLPVHVQGFLCEAYARQGNRDQKHKAGSGTSTEISSASGQRKSMGNSVSKTREAQSDKIVEPPKKVQKRRDPFHKFRKVTVESSDGNSISDSKNTSIVTVHKVRYKPSVATTSSVRRDAFIEDFL